MFDHFIDIMQSIIDGIDSSLDTLSQTESDFIESVYNALSHQGIDLSCYSETEIREALDYALSHKQSHIQEVSFTGLTAIEPIADIQKGPTCGFEAIENIIQLSSLNYNNSLSEYLQHSELFDGGAVSVNGGFALNPEHYRHILHDFGVETDWHQFNNQTLVNAISENKGILAVGDAHYLDANSYPEINSFHAFVITDADFDDNGCVIKYKGIDSNFPNAETRWSPDSIKLALDHSPIRMPLLISNHEMNWPHKT